MRRNATKKIIPGAALAGAIALTGMQTVGAAPRGAGIMQDMETSGRGFCHDLDGTGPVGLQRPL